MWEKVDLTDFECGSVVVARRAEQSKKKTKTADIFSRATDSVIDRV